MRIRHRKKLLVFSNRLLYRALKELSLVLSFMLFLFDLLPEFLFIVDVNRFDNHKLLPFQIILLHLLLFISLFLICSLISHAPLIIELSLSTRFQNWQFIDWELTIPLNHLWAREHYTRILFYHWSEVFKVWMSGFEEIKTRVASLLLCQFLQELFTLVSRYKLSSHLNGFQVNQSHLCWDNRALELIRWRCFDLMRLLPSKNFFPQKFLKLVFWVFFGHFLD